VREGEEGNGVAGVSRRKRGPFLSRPRRQGAVGGRGRAGGDASTTGAGREQVGGWLEEEDKGSGLGWAAVASPQARFKGFSHFLVFCLFKFFPVIDLLTLAFLKNIIGVCKLVLYITEVPQKVMQQNKFIRYLFKLLNAQSRGFNLLFELFGIFCKFKNYQSWSNMIVMILGNLQK